MSDESLENSLDSQRIDLSSDSSVEIIQERPSRGWVNEHYTKIAVGSKIMRVCQSENCNKRYAAGTSHQVFKEHWAKEHGTVATPRKTLFMFHDELHINRMVKMVLSCHMSYNVVEQEHFKSFISSLNPNKRVISRHALSDLIIKSRTSLKETLCDKLCAAASVALTFDIWSVRKGARGFGCVTAHYVNSDGKMENLVLHFKRMKFPHDAETIREFIEEPINVYDLRGRIAAITTDNASNNIAAIRSIDGLTGLASVNLGFIHYKCVAHIFDLAMKDAVKELKSSIMPVREAVLAIRSSGKRKEKFVETQLQLIADGEQTTSQPLELIEDVDHRWNSSFALLERAHLLRKAISHMLNTVRGLEALSPIDWLLVEQIVSFVKPFNEATKRLCSATDVTISLVACFAPQLINHCAEYEACDNKWIANAASSMKSKLTDYELSMYHPVVDLAYFLDPRFKTAKMSDDSRQIVLGRLRNILDDITTDEHSSAESSEFFRDFEADDQVDELTHYCDSRRVKLGTNVVMWWKNNTDTYPKLSQIARQILPIQATSVASERTFSIAGDVDSKMRNRLSDESVENIVLFKSWMDFLGVE